MNGNQGTSKTVNNEHRPVITTLRVSNNALKSDTLPPRIKILDWGLNDTIKGDFKVTQKTVEKLAANQRALGFERVALDYNHCSIVGTPEHEELAKNGRPPMIFGYGRPNAIPGDGVWLEDLAWTPLGVDCARQFEDISPALQDERGEVTFIHSVALTPNGCAHGLTFFSAFGGRVQTPMTRSASASSAPLPFQFASVNDLRLPAALDVLPWGPGLYGAWIVNDVTVELLPANQRQFGLSRVPVIIPGQEPAVAAYGTVEVKEGSGVSLVNLEWTEAGREAVLHYAGLKPALWLNDAKEVVGLGGVTLCSADNSFDWRPLPRWLMRDTTALNAGSLRASILRNQGGRL